MAIKFDDPIDMTELAPPPPGRRERRKRETRDRLLHAARQLIAERGAGELTIAQVTERADIGFGTLYTYFASKDALMEAVVTDAIAQAAQRIGARALALDDPAQAAAASYRSFIRYARDEPDLASVLVHLADAEQLFETALLPYARQTLQRGVASGRFRLEDVELALMSVSAAALAAIRGTLAGRLGPEAEVAGATMMLRAFGLPAREAERVAARALPE